METRSILVEWIYGDKDQVVHLYNHVAKEKRPISFCLLYNHLDPRDLTFYSCSTLAAHQIGLGGT